MEIFGIPLVYYSRYLVFILEIFANICLQSIISVGINQILSFVIRHGIKTNNQRLRKSANWLMTNT